MKNVIAWVRAAGGQTTAILFVGFIWIYGTATTLIGCLGIAELFDPHWFWGSLAIIVCLVARASLIFIIAAIYECVNYFYWPWWIAVPLFLPGIAILILSLALGLISRIGAGKA